MGCITHNYGYGEVRSGRTAGGLPVRLEVVNCLAPIDPVFYFGRKHPKPG
jgi:hypothetical protein